MIFYILIFLFMVLVLLKNKVYNNFKIEKSNEFVFFFFVSVYIFISLNINVFLIEDFLSSLIFNLKLNFRLLDIFLNDFEDLLFLLSNNILNGEILILDSSLLFNLSEKFVYNIKLSEWLYVNNLVISWGIYIDIVTLVMFLVIFSISFLVIFFSLSYMKDDPYLSKFIMFLILFISFMIILVSADNFMVMFVGWEGVGVCSYLLINFWTTRIDANKAAIKAIIVNRVGDFCLTLAMVLIFNFFGSLDYIVIFSQMEYFTNDYLVNFLNLDMGLLVIIGILIFFAAVGKSAQLGLHIWLPDAMEGPTPVSALIHAATMVTAGVFLLIRCSYILKYSSFVLFIIVLFGASTSFFASTVGIFQNDIKKVIAYSTCSQLGYMIFSCGLMNFLAALFHLFNHAFFKALLFLAGGNVIHGYNNEQDMRKMGGLRNYLPFTYACFIFGSLSLAGFPFLSGFYSKDVILELSIGSYSISGYLGYFLGLMAAFCTAFYSMRLIYLVFLSNPNGFKVVYSSVHEAEGLARNPLLILLVGTCLSGYWFKDLFSIVGNYGISSSIYVSSVFVDLNLDFEFLPIFFKFLPFIVTMFGMGLSFFIYHNYFEQFLIFKQNSYLFKEIYIFLNKKWFFDSIVNNYVLGFVFNFGYDISFKLLDKGIIEFFGPSGIYKFLEFFSFYLSSVYDGTILKNFFSFFIGYICFFSLFYYLLG